MSVEEFYDGFADYQLRYLKRRNPRLAAIHRQLKPLLKERKPRSALDIGCGIGVTTEWVARQVSSVVGVDISPRAIGLARQHHRGPTFAVCPVPDEPLPEGPFDLVCLFDTLEHFPPNQRAAVFSRIADVVSDDGVVAVNIPSRLVALANSTHESRQIIDEAIGADEIVALAAAIGMEPLTLHRYGAETVNQYVFCAFSRHYETRLPIRSRPTFR